MSSKRAIIIFLLVFTMGLAVYAEAQNIVFVTREDAAYFDPNWGDYSDYPFILALDSKGYTITKFYNTSLSTASQASLDTLNNADLVIMGRSTPSDMYDGADKPVWNGITAPILNLSLWSTRSSRMNWFNSTASANIDDAVPYDAMIDMPEDPVFDGIDVSGDVPWCNGPASFLQEVEAGNGIVLARESVNQWVLFVRWEPGIEFFPGSVDMPAGHRTLIGNGNDNGRTAEGAHIFNFWNFTEQSEKVYIAEVARMVKLGPASVADKKNTDGPGHFKLSQNYPNPFNPTTTISYSLNTDEHVMLKVYNMQGQEIATLVNDSQHAGNYDVSFDASQLSSGLYFYKLSTGKFEEARKMTLLR